MKKIENSNNFIETFADMTFTIGSSVNGDDFVTFVFLGSRPDVYINDVDQVACDSIGKERRASVTMTQKQAKRFYDSLKDIFEDE